MNNGTLARLRVLQWNILYQEPIDNVVALIREINPDVVCLQELARANRFNLGIKDTAQYVKEALGYQAFIAPAGQWTGMGGTEPGDVLTFQNGIFSRFPLSKMRKVRLGESGRMYLEAAVTAGNSEVIIGTTHLSYSPRFEITEDKSREVRVLIKAVQAEPSDRFVLTGDLNAVPGSYTITELERYLKHCGPVYQENTWTTKPFSHDGFTADTLDWRLDYVFARPGIHCTSAAIIETAYSDHLPILAEFEF